MDKDISSAVKVNNEVVTTQSEEKQTFIWPLNDAKTPYYMSINPPKHCFLSHGVHFYCSKSKAML